MQLNNGAKKKWKTNFVIIFEGDGETEVDWQEFFEEYYGYSTYYFALDENGNELEDIEDDNVTLNEFRKKHNL